MPRRRLVEDQQVRLATERQAQRELGLHPFGELAHVGRGGQAEQVEGAVHERLIPASAGGAEEGAELRHCHALIQAVGFADEADTRVDLQPVAGDVVAQDVYAATRRRTKAQQRLDGRRLAGAVRAQQPVDGPTRHAQCQAIHRAAPAIADDQIGGRDGRLLPYALSG